MIDISVKGLVKAFEVDKNILDGVTFEINSGERVGILGKNGAGKTTLFRILVDELSSDEGTVVIAPGKRIGLISQIPKYPGGYTTEDVLKTAHSRIFELSDRIQEMAGRMADDPAVMREYDRLTAEFERLGGYEAETMRNKVANGLDIPGAMRRQLFSDLSGGEKTRVNLARLILEDTDILLLDEPTNHLDMRATEWLEEYLLKFKGTVLAISHDRYFLDRVMSRTIEIVSGKCEFYSGNYSFYIVEKQRRYDEQLKQYEKEQKEIKRLDEAARRLYQWGTGNEKLMKKSFAIRSRIEHISKTERPDKDKKLRVAFGEKEFFGDEIISADGLSKAYGDKELFSGLSFEVGGAERIALIGDNGTGKSSLIEIIMGAGEPDTGWVRRGPSVRCAYLPQIIEFPDVRRSMLDTVIYDSDCSPQTARNRLGSFKFSGEDVFKPVSALSGGEQSRLRLCMLMKDDINFLILDEPTNHLDINSREWIEEAVEDYGEALLFVSHDRYFIDRFATRIWELSGGVLTDFRGTFEEYRQYKEKTAATEQRVKRETAKKTPAKRPASPEKQLAKLERDISKLEEELSGIDAEVEANATDYEKLLDLGEMRERADAALNALYEQWEELAQ